MRRRHGWRPLRVLVVMTGTAAVMAGTFAAAFVATRAVDPVTTPAVEPAETTSAVRGTTYYVSATGDDAAAGTSALTSWKTLARADRQSYRAGDRLLLAGGQTFGGDLAFTALEAGTAEAPITVSTFGAGRARIQVTAPNASGLSVTGAGGYEISNLDVLGPGRMTSTVPGVRFLSTVAGRRAHVHVTDVTVSNFNQGLVVGAVGKTAGFEDVDLTSVTATGNADAGIETYGDHTGSITDVRISDAVASDNPGVPGKTSSTGNGIVLGDVSNAVVSQSITAHNGTQDVASLEGGATNGPAGMWAYDSTSVTFRNNESYDNMTGNHVDGDGFDLDQSVTNSTLEYNYSYGNAGAGFLLDGTAEHPNKGNTVRYNISEYNGWDNNYAGLELVGAVSGAELYNNTVYASPLAPTRSLPQAIHIDGTDVGAAFRNNLLVATGGLALVEVSGLTDSLTFQGNDYWSSGQPLTIVWGQVSYHGLAPWRRATGQELLDRRSVGLTVDPQVVNPDGGGIVSQATQLPGVTALKLKSTSTLVDAGLDLSQPAFHLTVAGEDFFGSRVGTKGPYSIGAGQRPVSTHTPVLPRTFLLAAGAVAIGGVSVSATQGNRRRRQKRSTPA